MKNKRGDTYVTVCVFMLVIFMIFSAVFTFASAVTLIKVQQSNTEIVFDSFIANNSILIYNNIKMGKNATDGVKTAELTQTLVQFCSLTKNGTRYYCYDDEANELFNITAPIRFAGVSVATAVIPVNITAELRSKN